MYKPSGRNIKCYDVNSLYPSVMKNNKFPVGNITYFEGDITILGNDKYWIGSVDVNTNKTLYQPYLQIHYKTPVGFRTISLNGSFKMVINSPEYFNAQKDYDFKINHGYFFDSANIFNDFVTDFYNFRSKYPKGDPMNMTCKLIMNSLYGRFAMKSIFSSQLFTSRDNFMKLTEKYQIEDFFELGDNEFFVLFEDTTNFYNEQKISIGIASAVTAYGRIVLSKFKNNPKINLFYTDNDSIFIDSELSNNLVNNQIGKFKEEYTFLKAVFLGPKIYAGITNDNKYICKIKGYKNPSAVSFENMESLLNENKKLELKHTK